MIPYRYRCTCGWEGTQEAMGADAICGGDDGEEVWSNHICPECGHWGGLADYERLGDIPHLFNLSDFKSHGGATLPWKIDCDALQIKDWRCVAAAMAKQLSPWEFGHVEGVPRGGLLLAMALLRYRTPGGGLLIVDDVLTTGGSMEAHRAGRKAQGIVLFARGPCPSWVDALWYGKGVEW